VIVVARPDDLAGGGDELDLEQAVDRQPVLALEPADAAAEGQPGNAGVRDGAGGDREAALLRGTFSAWVDEIEAELGG
jgi:hypothetical protein